jgi:hypothetical protein
MLLAGLRRLIAAHRMVWSPSALLLAAPQPFLAAHPHADHAAQREATLFVLSSVRIDQPDAFRS